MLSFDLISTKMPFGGRKNELNRVKTTRGTQKTAFGCFFYLLQLFLAFSNTT